MGSLHRGILTINDPLLAPNGRHVRDGSLPVSQSLSPDACRSMAVPAETGLASSGWAGVTNASVGRSCTRGTRTGPGLAPSGRGYGFCAMPPIRPIFFHSIGSMLRRDAFLNIPDAGNTGSVCPTRVVPGSTIGIF